jgi:hypothetical protein
VLHPNDGKAGLTLPLVRYERVAYFASLRVCEFQVCEFAGQGIACLRVATLLVRELGIKKL